MSKRPGGTAHRDADGRLSDSSYVARIERQLALMRITPMTIFQIRKGIQPSSPKAEYEIIDVRHKPGFKCELCGHNPIVNVFTIKHKTTGVEKLIGSECAGNWVDADLARAMIHELLRRKASIKNELKFRDLFDWYATFVKSYGGDEDFEKGIERLKQGRSLGNAELKRLLDAVTQLPEATLKRLKEQAESMMESCTVAQRKGFSFPSGWAFSLALVRRGRAMVRDYQLALEIELEIQDD